MDEINRVAMRVVLLNNRIDEDLAQLKNMHEIVRKLNDKQHQQQQPQQTNVSQMIEDVSLKYEYPQALVKTNYDYPQELVRVHFSDFLDDGDFSEYDPFRIIKPIMWMGKDCSSFFDRQARLKDNRKKFTLNLARNMWGTRILAASKFLQSHHSLQRVYLRSKDPTGYDAFQSVLKCWYIFYELRLQPTPELYANETETNEFVKWHRYQLCMIMQSSRDCKRMKQIGPFDAYYYKLLSDGYKPRESWSLDSERIPKRYFQTCHQIFDVQHPISSVVYSLQPYEPITAYIPRSPKMTKKRKLLLSQTR